MKNLLYIFIFISVLCKAQVMNRYPMDYHMHVQGSMFIQTGITSLVYWKTEKNFLSNLVGDAATLIISIVGKEYIYDKYLGKGTFSKLDIEGDVRGVVYAHFINGISIHEFEKKQYIDTLKFVNLSTMPIMGLYEIKKDTTCYACSRTSKEHCLTVYVTHTCKRFCEIKASDDNILKFDFKRKE